MALAIGLDVSETRMGFAIISYENYEPLTVGVLNLRERDEGWIEDQILRAMAKVHERVLEHGYEKESVWVVGVEDVYFSGNIKVALRHAGAVGMARVAAQEKWGSSCLVVPIAADEWRKKCDIPYAKKRAEKKHNSIEWAKHILGTNEVQEDAAEALGIATAVAKMTEVASDPS